MKRWLAVQGKASFIVPGLFMGSALAVALLWAPFVHAQSSDLEVLLDRMDRMQRDIRTLNLQISGGKTTSSPALTKGGTLSSSDGTGHAISRLEVRLAALEEDLRSATGAAESMTHQLIQINERLEKLIGDVDYRLSAIEQSRGGGRLGQPGGQTRASMPQISAAPSPPSVETTGTGPVFPTGGGKPGTLGEISVKDAEGISVSDGGRTKDALSPAVSPAMAQVAVVPSVLPEGTPKEQYAFAISLLRKNDFDTAEKAFNEFLKVHANHTLAGNARYWLGDTHYVRKSYVQAAEVYLSGYQASPKGTKAPDTLLKLGMSLARLEKAKEACAAFTKLTSEFPNAPSRIQRTLARERERSDCQ